MTLRYRLLLVYLIVVLLSGATVGFAVFELRHAHRIIRELQDWNAIVLNVEKLKSKWPPLPTTSPQEFDLTEPLRKQARYLSDFQDTLDVDRVREALYGVYEEYEKWLNSADQEKANNTFTVLKELQNLSRVLEYQLDKLNIQADYQSIRIHILLVIVIGLTAIHVVVIRSLLRQWLLRPMQQLNRQVEALAHDQPPPEPILTKPPEMANLAQALDRARQSLRDLRQQLIQSERMTTIGQFTAQLAHNLRNPLASIRAVAQAAARHFPNNQSLNDSLNEIISSVDRLNYWIAGLMEVARREPTPTRSADIVPGLHRASDALTKELAAKELTLVINAPEDGLVCRHDPDILEHTLIAVITNAIEASPIGA
ncbi:MAG: HAMP domain-containing histidine kinase, partial [Planctomycetota bacterium]